MLTRAVTRGATRPLVIADMPFGSFQVSDEDAVANADPLREGGRRGRGQARRRRARCSRASGRSSTRASRSWATSGSRRNRRRCSAASRRRAGQRRRRCALYDDARALDAAGCFSLVLEAVPAPVAARITRELVDPDDRHRRRRGLRRAGARLARPARALRRVEPRASSNGTPRSARRSARRSREYRGRRAEHRLPGGAAHVRDARRGARALRASRVRSSRTRRRSHASSATAAATSEASERSQLHP